MLLLGVVSSALLAEDPKTAAQAVDTAKDPWYGARWNWDELVHWPKCKTGAPAAEELRSIGAPPRSSCRSSPVGGAQMGLPITATAAAAAGVAGHTQGQGAGRPQATTTESPRKSEARITRSYHD